MEIKTNCPYCGKELVVGFFDTIVWEEMDISIDTPVREKDFECEHCGKTTTIRIYLSGGKKEEMS